MSSPSPTLFYSDFCSPLAFRGARNRRPQLSFCDFNDFGSFGMSKLLRRMRRRVTLCELQYFFPLIPDVFHLPTVHPREASRRFRRNFKCFFQTQLSVAIYCTKPVYAVSLRADVRSCFCVRLLSTTDFYPTVGLIRQLDSSGCFLKEFVT